MHQALTERVVERLESDEAIRVEVEGLVERIVRGDLDPYTAAARVMERL